jgi:hypothetical protein
MRARSHSDQQARSLCIVRTVSEELRSTSPRTLLEVQTLRQAPRTVAFKPEIQKTDSRIDELKKSVEVMQSKLDRILHAVERGNREDTISKIAKSARTEAGEAVDTVAELVAETSGKVKKSLKKTLTDIGDSISEMAAPKKKAAAKRQNNRRISAVPAKARISVR